MLFNIWRAPFDFRFEVNKETMLAHDGPGLQAESTDSTSEGIPGELPPCIGHVRGGGRPTALRFMPGTPASAELTGFTRNCPRCPQCGGMARPAILMFGDCDWVPDHAQQKRWKRWHEAVQEVITGRTVRAVVLEIGAGKNVPTVRLTSERVLMNLHKAGADVKLVRVNPDLPFGDHWKLQPGASSENLVISVMGRGLESIRKIDGAMPVISD